MPWLPTTVQLANHAPRDTAALVGHFPRLSAARESGLLHEALSAESVPLESFRTRTLRKVAPNVHQEPSKTAMARQSAEGVRKTHSPTLAGTHSALPVQQSSRTVLPPVLQAPCLKWPAHAPVNLGYILSGFTGIQLVERHVCRAQAQARSVRIQTLRCTA